jgi:uncharacterized membrane protein YfcA
LLIPLFAVRYGTKLAVAIVSIPHVAATVARFWSLRKYVDRRVFLNFGILSAAGGSLGALLNARANSPAWAMVFGCLRGTFRPDRVLGKLFTKRQGWVYRG